METSYLATTRDIYREAALSPQQGLCCTTAPVWQLPGLVIPKRMLAMNYGCGSTVHPRDLAGNPTVLYVGVGGGMELLQFAYFCRRRDTVIGLDVVDEMLAACRDNLAEARAHNPWFESSFVDLRRGDALALPVAVASAVFLFRHGRFSDLPEFWGCRSCLVFRMPDIYDTPLTCSKCRLAAYIMLTGMRPSSGGLTRVSP